MYARPKFKIVSEKMTETQKLDKNLQSHRTINSRSRFRIDERVDLYSSRMDLNVRVDVNCVKVTETNSANFILITLNTEVPLMIHAKFQPNIPSRS